MKTMLRAVARRTPYLGQVFRQRDSLRDTVQELMRGQPTYHSPEHRVVGQRAENAPLPPQPLAYRVIGNDNLAAFQFSGMRCVSDLATALYGIGRAASEFRDIYDFGCGCGRLLRWFPALAPDANFYGSDTDPEAIAWCQEHLTFAKCVVNPPLPPTSWPDGSFDLLYASSVLTHLDEERQFLWLAEIRRLVRVGGIALVTVHGPSTVEGLPEDLKAQHAKTGFLFRSAGNFWKGVFPDWYGNSNHSRAYVAEVFGRYFKVHAQLDRGLAHYQDIVVLERTA